MADTTLNNFLSSGTAAERAAYTPTPPTPASGPDPGYFWFETDTGLTYSWNGAAWVQTGGGGANSVTAAGTLTANRIVLGAGTKTVAELGSLGTTTTVLHGNAAGAPTFGAVSLTADVSGILPVANGGTGSASGGAILSATVALTNAQILALPTTGIQIIAAPGSGFRINFIQATLTAKFTGGAYTGASAVSSSIQLVNGDGKTLSNYIANDNGVAIPFAYLTTFLDNTNKVATLVPFSETTDVAADWGNLAYVETAITSENKSLVINAANGAVNFGGGNAANTLSVKVLYTVDVY